MNGRREDAAALEVANAARRLREAGVLSPSYHGNISMIADPSRGRFLMSGNSLRNLRSEDLALLSSTGEVLEGGMRGTDKEVIAMHAVVYARVADARCVIHTHSPSATAFAVARRPIPCVCESLARWGFFEDVPVAEYGPRGSAESVRHIAECLESHPQTPGVVLANHGILVFGSSGEEVVRRCVALEENSDVALRAAALGGAQRLSRSEAMDALSGRERASVAPGSGT